jgi:hypothetical protein
MKSILFSSEMVRKILAGEKTQTRRIIGEMSDIHHFAPPRKKRAKRDRDNTKKNALQAE